ncbi:signal peptidase II [Candidatus Omnitrophota bacterium]
MPGGKRKTAASYLIITILIIDQLSKYIISHNFLPGQSVPLIKNFFHITYVLNRGAAFGIFKGQLFFFIIAAVGAIVFILVNLRRQKALQVKIALSLIASGAASNLIDRLRLGGVIDFLDFRVWPVFNIADSAITIGAILLAYSMLFIKDNKAFGRK